MDDYDTIGKTVVEYTDNLRHIACLKKQASDIGEDLVRLGQGLQNDPTLVSVTADSVRLPMDVSVSFDQHFRSMPLTSMDVQKLQRVLCNLKDAEQQGERLEITLRGMRLPELIQPD